MVPPQGRGLYFKKSESWSIGSGGLLEPIIDRCEPELSTPFILNSVRRYQGLAAFKTLNSLNMPLVIQMLLAINRRN
jgi:hypothetical protein